MSRYKEREQAFLLMFEHSFSDSEAGALIEVFEENIEPVGDYAKELFLGATEKAEEIDTLISRYSTGWKLHRIPKVNAAILRIALYEMRFVEDVPDSVAVNEAVELSKKFSGSDDYAFINGVLGAYSRSKD